MDKSEKSCIGWKDSYQVNIKTGKPEKKVTALFSETGKENNILDTPVT